MKRNTVVWLVLAGAIVLVVGALFVFALAMANWDISSLGFKKFVTETVEIGEKAERVEVLSETADVTLVPSKDGHCRVTFCVREDYTRSAAVKSGTLQIENRKEKDGFSLSDIFSFGSSEITVELPAGEYESLSVTGATGDVVIPGDYRFNEMQIAVSTGKVECSASVTGTAEITGSTGRITAENMKAGEIRFTLSTGRILLQSVDCTGNVQLKSTTGAMELTDVRCRDFSSDASTGRLTMKNVLAEGQMTIERSTGDVSFDACDAAELFVKTSTGDVTGTLRSEKVFATGSTTGRIEVPETVTGGKCKITTTTGDIRIGISGQ